MAKRPNKKNDTQQNVAVIKDAAPQHSKNPAENVERREVKSLVPYARNSRKHSEQQIQQIAGSMKEWGFTTPVLIDPQGGIIAGHGRVMAAQLLGLSHVPCIVAHGWTDAQKRAYVIADNKLALNAEWDDDMLKIELHGLHEQDFDMGKLGFDGNELQEIMYGELDVDEVEEIDVNESCNLIIKCDDIAQREALKTMMKTQKDKITAEEFLAWAMRS